MATFRVLKMMSNMGQIQCRIQKKEMGQGQLMINWVKDKKMIL